MSTRGDACLPLIGVIALTPLLLCVSLAAQDAPLDRTVLPIPEPNYPHITELDARKVKAPPRFEVKAPANAPNVLIILIDDMGFGQSSAFGGPIHMPTAERLARQRPSIQQLSHHRALLAHSRGVVDRTQSPHE